MAVRIANGVGVGGPFGIGDRTGTGVPTDEEGSITLDGSRLRSMGENGRISDGSDVSDWDS